MGFEQRQGAYDARNVVGWDFSPQQDVTALAEGTILYNLAWEVSPETGSNRTPTLIKLVDSCP